MGVARACASAYDAWVKKAIATLFGAVAMAAHARYEDVRSLDGPPVLGVGNLLPYLLIGCLVWAVAVWSRGWRARAVPLLVAGAALALGVLWGPQGLGGLMLGLAAGALLWGVFRRR